MVNNLNMILLTSSELFELRLKLKDLNSEVSPFFHRYFHFQSRIDQWMQLFPFKKFQLFINTGNQWNSSISKHVKNATDASSIYFA